jgi:hypothetical protein
MNIGAPELLIILVVLGIPLCVVGVLVWLGVSNRKHDAH